MTILFITSILLALLPRLNAFATPPITSFGVKSNSHSSNVIFTPRKSRSFLRSFESADEVQMDTVDKMENSRDALKRNLKTIRTGRANAAILDLVSVDYYGAATPLNQMASISVPNSQQLNIDPYDKTALEDIEKAIIEADLGINPNNDGSIIRINIPSLTEDRRKELLKMCKAIGEEGKVSDSLRGLDISFFFLCNGDKKCNTFFSFYFFCTSFVSVFRFRFSVFRFKLGSMCITLACEFYLFRQAIDVKSCHTYKIEIFTFSNACSISLKLLGFYPKCAKGWCRVN